MFKRSPREGPGHGEGHPCFMQSGCWPTLAAHTYVRLTSKGTVLEAYPESQVDSDVVVSGGGRYLDWVPLPSDLMNADSGFLGTKKARIKRVQLLTPWPRNLVLTRPAQQAADFSRDASLVPTCPLPTEQGRRILVGQAQPRYWAGLERLTFFISCRQHYIDLHV